MQCRRIKGKKTIRMQRKTEAEEKAGKKERKGEETAKDKTKKKKENDN